MLLLAMVFGYVATTSKLSARSWARGCHMSYRFRACHVVLLIMCEIDARVAEMKCYDNIVGEAGECNNAWR